MPSVMFYHREVENSQTCFSKGMRLVSIGRWTYACWSRRLSCHHLLRTGSLNSCDQLSLAMNYQHRWSDPLSTRDRGGRRTGSVLARPPPHLLGVRPLIGYALTDAGGVIQVRATTTLRAHQALDPYKGI